MHKPPVARQLHLDHLRNAVILGLILFHTARLFDDDPWHLKHNVTFPAADLLIAAFNIVQMPLLFLLAGMTLYQSLETRGGSRFLRERCLRLLLPLVIGILLVVPPQVWAERIAIGAAGRISPIDFSGNLFAFYPGFFACCYPAANFSWHHLWFLVYLFAYATLLLPLFLLLRREKVAAGIQALGRWFAHGHRLWLLALPTLASELLLRQHFPETHALIDDWATHTHYVILLLIGWLLAASNDLRAALARHWRLLLLVAGLLILAWLALAAIGYRPMMEIRQMHRAMAEWAALAGLIGWSSLHLARPLPFLTAFTRVSFPFYVFHQTVIVLLGLLFLGWTDPALVKFLVIATLAFALSLGLAFIAGQSTVSRMMFGLR